MKTVGLLLKEARTAKKLSLEEVETATKIRKKFLLGIESDDYRSLPSQAYAKGFVKNYGDFLGLNTTTLLAFFRRQSQDVAKSSLLPKDIEKPLKSSWFQLTPGRFLALVIATFAAIFLLYLGVQYQKLHAAPTLIVDSLKTNVQTSEKRIDIIGKTDNDATVTINGISVIVRSDGKFFDQLLLNEGKNIITLVATSRFGKTTTVMRDVLFQSQ